MFDAEKFYSNLGSAYEPGVITQVVLVAFELMRKGKKIEGKEKPDGKYYTGKFLDNDKYAMKQFATENDKGEKIAHTVKESYYKFAGSLLKL